MNFTKKLRIGTGLGLVCLGVVLGTALRFWLMLRCFDYDTGFYTDGGAAAWLSLLLPVLLALGGAWCFFRCKRGFAAYRRERDLPSGALAAFSGLIFLYTGFALTSDYAAFRGAGFSQFETAQQGFVHLSLLAMCWAFGLVQLLAAAGFFAGRNLFARAPLLYVLAVLWGMANLVAAYVFYARSSSFVENFCTVGGGAALLLGLFYACRMFAGVGEPAAALRLFVTGGVAAVLVIPYHLANLVLALMGRTYEGEMPALFSLCIAAAGVFLLVLMAGYARTSLDPNGSSTCVYHKLHARP